MEGYAVPKGTTGEADVVRLSVARTPAGAAGCFVAYLHKRMRGSPLDRLDVLVELNPGEASASESDKRMTAEALQNDIKSYVRLATRVRIVASGDIERSQGKANHVRDRRLA